MKLLLSIILVLSFVSQCTAVDVKVEGIAAKDFHRIGAWGWDVNIEKVISGPDDLQGKLISIYLTSANPAVYPPGSLDSNIKAGDRVEALGQLETIEPGDYNILLVGSSDYYLRPATGQ
jgi:hypothetical protein